ncbi:ABC transporter ATP-binding protein [Clostridiaceae bacterium M8S5]|nr:ABC transporter ATP-binding protein [Clostridiaceae bacterium M8S5]
MKKYKDLKILRDITLHHKNKVLLAIILSIGSVAIKLLQVYYTQKLVNNSMESQLTWFTPVILLMLIGLLSLITTIKKIAIKRYAIISIKELKLRVLKTYLKTDYLKLQEYATGNLISIINNDCNNIEGFLAGILFDLPIGIITAVGAYIYMFILDPKLALITFIYTPFGMVLANRIIKKQRKLYEVESSVKGKIMSSIEQRISTIEILKSFVMHKYVMEYIGKHYDELCDTKLRLRRYDTMMQPTCLALANIPGIIFSLYGGYMALNNQLDFGNYIAILNLIGYIIPTTVMLPFILSGLNNSIVSIKRITKYVDLSVESEHIDCEKAQSIDYIKAKAIEIKNLKFGYDNENILNNLSIKFDAVGITAIVGTSGAGKSTLISLLAGLYKADQGTVMISGRDINKMDRTELKKYMTYVPQVIHIFNDSILSNIILDNHGIDDDEVNRIIKECGLNEFVEDMANNYETLVGEKGIKLSGGQKKKIGFARAYANDSNIWLLDEPTSALDKKSKQDIINLISKLAIERNIIISTHNPQIMQLASNIIFLNNETNYTKGTFDEMLKYREFRDMINLEYTKGGLYEVN